MKMEMSGGDWSKFENCLHRLVLFDFKGMHQDIGEYIINSTKERFRNGVDPDGNAWKPSKRSEDEGGKTLQNTRTLYNSISYRASMEGVEVGTNVKYARVHQGLDKSGNQVKEIVIVPKQARLLAFTVSGKKVFAKKVTISARPFMGINEADAKEITSIGQEWIEEATGK